MSVTDGDFDRNRLRQRLRGVMCHGSFLESIDRMALAFRGRQSREDERFYPFQGAQTVLPLAAVRARSSIPVRVQVVDPRRGRVVVSVCCGPGNKLSELLGPSERSGHSSRPALCTVASLFLLLKAISQP
ncbi:hypothetical protein SADUNF_Sadunf19G0046200 [Salix dunnii]|uniref:Uncharacterized protein n=1 Tax=Salix dunnii TaxID=1413687 RepID=A0A835J1S6_9ROSI|nr:hypothetical protein SADUNF_Sadunf19G0046200 [Salix dunnii]